MKHYLKIFVVLLSLGLVSSCDFDDDFTEPDYVTFEAAPSGTNVGVEVGGTTTYDVKVYTANVVDQARTFNVLVLDNTSLGSEGYSVPATVTIPAGSNEGTLSVQVSDVGLGVAGKALNLNIQEEAGFSVGKPIRLNVARVCPGKEFVIDIVFDGYSDETSYSLVDSAGETIISAAAGSISRGTATLNRSLCIPAGTYTFNIEDSYGDGLTYPNLGSVTISYAGTVLTSFDGNFGSGTSVEVSF
ncbi:hypothetical protein DHD80_11350 [Gramella sp. AN32]|nr:hypothetical protein [Gramella sp. AN32]